MKKIFLSISVIVAFIVYSLYQKDQNIVTSTFQTNQTVPVNTSTSPSQINRKKITYKDGIYTGKVADAFYGNIQVKTTISNGAISNIEFLQFPNDRHESIAINQAAMPLLKQEAIRAQSAQVDIVSGATDSSRAFVESMQFAISQAQ